MSLFPGSDMLFPSLFFLQPLLPRPYRSFPRRAGPILSPSFPTLLTVLSFHFLSFPKVEERKGRVKENTTVLRKHQGNGVVISLFI